MFFKFCWVSDIRVKVIVSLFIIGYVFNCLSVVSGFNFVNEMLFCLFVGNDLGRMKKLYS